MLKLRQDQMTIWDCVLPKELLNLNEELASIDKILDDEVFMKPFLKHWNVRIGRPTVPVETYLRMMYLKTRYKFGYHTLVDEVRDSFQWRRFCRISIDEKVPDHSTLVKLTQKYGEKIVQELNQALITKVTEEKVIRSRKLRVDTTVVESNIHYPTDSHLLADAIKVITRKAKKIQKALGESAPTVVDRSRSAKKRILAIGKLLKRRSGQAVESVREITEELVNKSIQTVLEAKEMLNHAEENLKEKLDKSVKRQIQKLDTIVQTAEKVIRQSRKVNRGETHIPNRVVSLHDPDARPIQKGKLGVKTEFGFKLEITENEARMVTDYKVHKGNPNDETLLEDAIKRHIKLTGTVPHSVATDRGFTSRDNEKALTSLGVKRVSIPKRGKKSQERAELEKNRWFKNLQRWRAGGEGTISVLKRKYGLDKSLSRGHQGVSTWVGFGILTYNLRRVATIK